MSSVRTLDERLDAALSLLDRQVVDAAGAMVCKVDDIELEERDGHLYLVTVLSGPGALGPRMGEPFGRWMTAIWRRLSPDGREGRIALAEVTELDSALHIERVSDEHGLQGLEIWMREHVVGRLPGAPHTATSDAGGRTASVDDRRRAEPGRRLGELLGMCVRARSGAELGRVSDARVVAGAGTVGYAAMGVEGLVVAQRDTGSMLGYDRREEQGPRLVRWIVSALHRKAGYVAWDDVADVDWDAGVLRLRVDVLAELTDA